jgi:hypothetical protein
MIQVAARLQAGLNAHGDACELHIHPLGWFVFFDNPEFAARSVLLTEHSAAAYIDQGDATPFCVGHPVTVDQIYAFLVDGTFPNSVSA